MDPEDTQQQGGAPADPADNADTAEEAANPTQKSPAGDPVDTPKKMTVDIHGVTVEVDEKTAQQIIEKRQASKEQLRQLETQLEDARRTREDAESRARAAEAAKAGDLERVERELTEKYAQRLDKMHRAVIRSNVEAALRAHPDFIGGEASTKDAIQMLLATGDLKVDEQTLLVKAGDKDINQAIGDFLATRDHFRKARPGPRGPRGEQNQQKGTQPNARKELPRKSIAEGIQRRYGAT